jgi:hypothetical protein
MALVDETQKYGHSSIRRYLDDGTDPFKLLEACWDDNGFGAEVEPHPSLLRWVESRTTESKHRPRAAVLQALPTSDSFDEFRRLANSGLMKRLQEVLRLGVTYL